MELKIEKNKITFDLDNEIPFFQVGDKYRVRFGIDDFNREEMKCLIREVFPNKMSCSLLTEILTPTYSKEKTNIGKYIGITNWKEDKYFSDVEYIIATIREVEPKELLNYSLYIKRGLASPFICFHDKKSVYYISDSVIDIVSSSTDFIELIKGEYQGRVNHYYDKT